MKIIFSIFCLFIISFASTAQQEHNLVGPEKRTYSVKKTSPYSLIEHKAIVQGHEKEADSLTITQTDNKTANISYKQSTPVVLNENERMKLAKYENKTSTQDEAENSTIPSVKYDTPVKIEVKKTNTGN